MPRQIGDGLLMRWAGAADTEELAEFNLRWHSEDPDGEPELWLQAWTRDLLSGRQSTAKANSVTVVVDPKKQNKIVSSTALIPQVWAYDGLSFGCGRPDLIATDPNYRRRGLARLQTDLFHAQSAARGDLLQAITGIPWYYRQFGYEMALDLGGGRLLPIGIIKDKPVDQDEQYILQNATLDDLPFLESMYGQLCVGNLITCVRDKRIWNYELNAEQILPDIRRNLWIVQTLSGSPVAYTDIRAFTQADTIRELEVAPGTSVRAITLFVARQLKVRGQRNESDRGPFTGITFKLGARHPVYEALRGELTRPLPPYAWYLRVPDLTRFLWHIKPVLEQRLSASVLAGYSGSLQLNFYHRQLRLEFSDGRLSKIEPYTPKHFFDGDAFFLDLTFLQLMFGYRSMEQLNYAHVDCFVDGGEAGVLLQALFPKINSKVVPVS